METTNLNSLLGSNFTILMLLGAVLVYLKALPTMIWDWFLIQTTMTITVVDDDNSFEWVKEWFLKQPFGKKVRRVNLDSSAEKNGIGVLPAPGAHWFWYKKRLYRFDFHRSTETKGWSPKRAETFFFRTFGRDRKVLEQLVVDITQAHRECIRESNVLYLWHDNNYWARYPNYKSRTMASVILRNGELEKVVKDIEWFLGAEEWYEHLAIPYHRGYLWYGIPGTGKTSLISVLAHKFKMPIYLMSLAGVDDSSLLKAMMGVVQNSIVVLEDVDCMGQMRKAPATNQKPDSAPGDSNGSVNNLFGVTLSGLLNILDGFKAPHGVMFMMTTNHTDRLDSALLRPGRVDFKLEFGKATIEQRLQLFQRFQPNRSEQQAIEFIMAHRSAQTMADFQSLLMTEVEKQKTNSDERTTEPMPVQLCIDSLGNKTVRTFDEETVN